MVVAIEAEIGEGRGAASAHGGLTQFAQGFDVHPNRIKQWQGQLLEGVTGVLGKAPKAGPEPTIDMKTLHTKIG